MPLEPTLHRDCYLTPAWFAREREQIFAREWACVGREEEIPNPGDYLLVELAGESLLVTRDKDGRLHAHHNVCRHRGSQLVPGQLPKGSWEAPGVRTAGAAATPEPEPAPACGHFASGIKCPYHAWTYNLDGTLRTAPFLEEGDGFRREDLPLWRAGLDTWGGFIFLRLTDGGPTLLEQLGGAPERVQRYPLAELRTARRITYHVAANWKVILENYNECYHCGPVHPELCRLVPAFRNKGGSELDWERGVPHREGAWTFTMSGTTDRKPFAGLNADELTRHKGELLYPNFMVSLSAEHAAAFALFPHDAHRTTITCDFLFHPDEMARPGFDPMDAVELWDITNRQDWLICESVQRGMGSRVFERGFYAPMESWSLDIRRYIRERCGPTP